MAATLSVCGMIMAFMIVIALRVIVAIMVVITLGVIMIMIVVLSARWWGGGDRF